MIVIIILFLFLIIISLIIYYLYRTKKSFNYAIYNDIYCSKSDCKYNLENLSVPDIIDNEYNNELAIFNTDLIVRMTNAIKADNNIVENKNVEKIYSINKDGKLFSVIYKDPNKNNIFILFRPTSFLNDVLNDLNANQKYIDIFKNNSNNNKQVTLFDTIDSPKIHSGFLNLYEFCRYDIIQTVNKIRPVNIILSGHSLGGSLSILCGIDLYYYFSNMSNSEYKPNIIVYTYGSPKMGDERFSNIVNSYITVHRLVNISDIAPFSPFSVTPNFLDYKNPYFYDYVGKLRYANIQRYSLNQNHSIFAYIYGLKKNLFK